MTEQNRLSPKTEGERDAANALMDAALYSGADITPDQGLLMAVAVLDVVKPQIEQLKSQSDLLLKVKELHAKHSPTTQADRYGAEFVDETCDGCGNFWPCDTYKMLEVSEP